MIKALNKILFRKKSKYAQIDQLRYLSQSASIEEAVAPHVVRTTLIMVSVIIIALIIWASIADVEEIALTEGEVMPSQRVQSVQHLEGGIIKEINVREGDLVEEDQVLIVLDDHNVIQDLDALYARRHALLYNEHTLKSFIHNQNPDFKLINESKLGKNGEVDEELEKKQLQAYNSMVEARESEKKIIVEQIDQKNDSLKMLEGKRETLIKNKQLVEEELSMKKQLADKGHLSKFQYLQIQQKYNEIVGNLKETESAILQAQNSIEEYESRLHSLGKNHIDEAHQSLHVVEVDLSQIQERIEKLEAQVDRLKIKAPLHGYVKGIAVNTIGGVLDPGQVVMQVVPAEGHLLIETRIKPRDIGHIKPGLDVNVKVSSYDFSRYGTVKGKLKHISATTFTDEQGERYYLGRVSLDRNYVGSDPKQYLIIPGMTVQADIVTGSKSILNYLLRPIHKSVTTSFSER